MRHMLGNIATRAIVALLLLGALVFAWARSAQITFSTETTELSRFEPAKAGMAPTEEFDWRQIGELSYRRNCQQCHLDTGKGWDQYPGLNHTARLFAQPGGHDYLVDVHLYGLTSSRWGAPMPPMRHMPDVDLAAAINHVLTSFGNEQTLPTDAQLYKPEDIAARRNLDLSPAQVNEQRPALEE